MDCIIPVLHDLPELAQIHVLSQRCYLTISSSLAPYTSCRKSFIASGSFPMSHLFVSSGQSTGDSALASVLPMNNQGWLPSGLTGWYPCSPRDSQESSSALQFKNISSSVLSLLYGPTLTSIHDFWKTHRFDDMDFCQQSDVFAF